MRLCVYMCVLTMKAILWQVHIQHEVIIIQLSSSLRVKVIQDILRMMKITGNTLYYTALGCNIAALRMH